MHQLSISDVSCSYMHRENYKKQRKFVATFVYSIDEALAIFSNLGDWHAAKTCACLLRLSVLRRESSYYAKDIILDSRPSRFCKKRWGLERSTKGC